MKQTKKFKTLSGENINLPIFFPDATRAVLRTLDSADIRNTQTGGLLVNTFHLSSTPGKNTLKMFKGVRNFMNWNGGLISDSGGFQVMSIAKKNNNKNSVTDKGVVFKMQGQEKILFTPEKSIRMQSSIKPDMMVVLDDFTPPEASYQEALETVERTIL